MNAVATLTVKHPEKLDWIQHEDLVSLIEEKLKEHEIELQDHQLFSVMIGAKDVGTVVQIKLAVSEEAKNYILSKPAPFLPISTDQCSGTIDILANQQTRCEVHGYNCPEHEIGEGISEVVLHSHTVDGPKKFYCLDACPCELAEGCAWYSAIVNMKAVEKMEFYDERPPEKSSEKSD